MAAVLFAIVAGLTAASAVGVLVHRGVVRSALSLLFTLVGVALCNHDAAISIGVDLAARGLEPLWNRRLPHARRDQPAADRSVATKTPVRVAHGLEVEHGVTAREH